MCSHVRSLPAASSQQPDPDHTEIPTFLVAGHETTSTLLAWVLFALAQRPDLQAALRAKCRSAPLPTGTHGNAPLTMAELAALDKLPLLDAVLRETLRLHAPVPAIGRTATRDDVLPVSAPFVDRAGVARTSLPVRRGEDVFVPIRLVNCEEAIWGPDAAEWRCVALPPGLCARAHSCDRPERWMDGSAGEKAKSIPGLWGSTLTFSGGSHSCIGYKFSLYECVFAFFPLSAGAC
jgi:cytochrome P450